MPRTASRIYGPALIATGPATVYTVPALTKAVLRAIHVMNQTGTAATFTMSIGADGATTRIFATYSIAANAPYDSFVPFTVDAAEIITLSSGTNNALGITIMADLYTLG